MIANYHTHTKRCNHAVGEEREYVEKAIESGLKVLGFSDHAPYLFNEKGYYSSFRMRPNLADNYCQTVLDLKKEYQKDIKILLGFELEYYKDTHQREMEYLRGFNPDYIILGQHYVGGEYNGYYAWLEGGNIELFKQYIDECIEGLRTGDFLYLAHPDIIGVNYPRNVLEREYTRLLSFMTENNIPAEINLLGIMGNRSYPNREFFEIAKKCGTKVLIGVDAHTPLALNKDLYNKGYDLVKGLNLNFIDKFDI